MDKTRFLWEQFQKESNLIEYLSVKWELSSNERAHHISELKKYYQKQVCEITERRPGTIIFIDAPGVEND